MPAPELVGQSSFHLGGVAEERELFIPLERRVIECGASCVNIPSSRDSFFGTHAAWSPHIMLPGGIARTGCRQFGTPAQGTDKARTCGEVDRSDPDSWDGKILTDCVGCGCDETAQAQGGQFRGVGFFCRLGVGVMLWTNDQDVAGITGDPDLFPGFNPGGNTWGLVEFDVFKPQGCIWSSEANPANCISEYFLGNEAHLELRGCDCCYDRRNPRRSCGLHARLHSCGGAWVRNDCNLDVSPCEPDNQFGRDCCNCIGDPGSFVCAVSGQRNNRPYYAGRWCNRGHYIGQARFLGVLRGQHSHVDDQVVSQNFDRFWAHFDFEDSQFCYTDDWGRFVGSTGHKLRVTHRIDPRVNSFFELERDAQFQGWIPLRQHWIEFTSVRSGFRDWPVEPGDEQCAHWMGEDKNGRTVEGPFPPMGAVSFGGA